jgi:hypothetical protein
MESENTPPQTSVGQKGAEEAKSELRAGTGVEPPRVEVSAATVTRMMGIATVTELRLLEGRIDLLTAKVTSVLTKVDKIISTVNALPSGSDMDRLEIQLGAIKAVMKEVLESVSSGDEAAKSSSKVVAQEQSRKMREAIKTSDDVESED